MTDLPASVGYITVTAKGIVASADSNDVGTVPDVAPMVATVEFKPSIGTPIVAVDESAPKPLIFLRTTTHDLDANGVLRPANDGSTAPPSDATGSVRLVAPEQTAISPLNWTWTATFKPAAGQKWTQFTVTFGGEPGDTVDLGDVYAAAIPPGAVAIADPWLKAWAKDPDTLIVGTLAYDTPDNPGELLTADVVWPDGKTGVLTVTGRHTPSRRATGWTITRGGVLTYTQPPITFNGNGDPIAIPAITVS